MPGLSSWPNTRNFPVPNRFPAMFSVALLPLPPRQVMRMWPFKQLLLRGNAAGAGKYALPCRHLHHFGDMQQLREALHLTNLLTGWVQGDGLVLVCSCWLYGWHPCACVSLFLVGSGWSVQWAECRPGGRRWLQLLMHALPHFLRCRRPRAGLGALSFPRCTAFAAVDTCF